ncbi:glycerol-3-phosphate dehydrogenase/oxidase [Candidatus Saganbacteria bacterium]|nr:glycerol-3-phosphate dehydrogenase/oxidase [Candidatus Saganbacteria bacterium]
MLNRLSSILKLRTNLHQGKRYDVAIVGGGIIGAAIAVSCARQGWSVLVVDKGDLAGETSANSTGLLHGGARYAEKLEFGMVLSAIRGREAFKRAAPHLVREVQYLVPAFSEGKHSYRKMQVGRWLYDATEWMGFSSFPRGRTANARELRLEDIPFAYGSIKGGSFFWDGQTDDHRLALTMLTTAAQYRAHVISRMECCGFIYSDGGKAQIIGLEMKDQLGTETFEVRANAVVNAAGSWAQNVVGLQDPHARQLQTLDAGSHLIVRNFFEQQLKSGFFAEFKDGRLVFILPHGENLLIGTTSEGKRESLANVFPLPEHNQYLLDGVNGLFPFANLVPADIIFAYSAHRALYKDPKAKNADGLSREHAVFVSPQGLITIIGGKITASPLIGEQVAKLAAKKSNRPFEKIPIDGLLYGATDSFDVFMREELPALSEKFLADKRLCRHLLLKYGKFAREVLEAAEGDKTLLEPLEPWAFDIGAQVVYAVRHEMALKVTDVLSRRIRLEREVGNGLVASERVAEIMAKELGWPEEEAAAHVSSYKEKVQRGKAAPRPPAG